jgi:hypothetical protein
MRKEPTMSRERFSIAPWVVIALCVAVGLCLWLQDRAIRGLERDFASLEMENETQALALTQLQRRLRAEIAGTALPTTGSPTRETESR